VGLILSGHLQTNTSANALLVITKPIFTSDLNARIQTVPQLPESRALIELVKADDLILAVYQDGILDSANDSTETFQKFKSRFDAVLVGSSQVRLEVIHSDPLRAAQLAEVWAEKALQRLNMLFGLDRTSLDQLAVEIDGTHKNWDDAEKNLLSHLSTSRYQALIIILDEEKVSLSRNIAKLSRIDMIISDARSMEARFQGMNRTENLPLEDALALIALQHRAVDGSGLFQIQITAPELLGEEYIVGIARNRLGVMVNSLQEQKKEIQRNVQALESLISENSS
jgi:hypothetical protein